MRQNVILQSSLSDRRLTAQDDINANFIELYSGVGIFDQPASAITDNYTMTDSLFFIPVDASLKNVTITLLDPAVYYTRPINIKRIDNSDFTVTIACAGGELVENEASMTLLGYECATVMSDKTNYWII